MGSSDRISDGSNRDAEQFNVARYLHLDSDWSEPFKKSSNQQTADKHLCSVVFTDSKRSEANEKAEDSPEPEESKGRPTGDEKPPEKLGNNDLPQKTASDKAETTTNTDAKIKAAQERLKHVDEAFDDVLQNMEKQIETESRAMSESRNSLLGLQKESLNTRIATADALYRKETNKDPKLQEGLTKQIADLEKQDAENLNKERKLTSLVPSFEESRCSRAALLLTNGKDKYVKQGEEELCRLIKEHPELALHEGFRKLIRESYVEMAANRKLRGLPEWTTGLKVSDFFPAEGKKTSDVDPATLSQQATQSFFESGIEKATPTFELALKAQKEQKVELDRRTLDLFITALKLESKIANASDDALKPLLKQRVDNDDKLKEADQSSADASALESGIRVNYAFARIASGKPELYKEAVADLGRSMRDDPTISLDDDFQKNSVNAFVAHLRNRPPATTDGDVKIAPPNYQGLNLVDASKTADEDDAEVKSYLVDTLTGAALPLLAIGLAILQARAGARYRRAAVAAEVLAAMAEVKPIEGVESTTRVQRPERAGVSREAAIIGTASDGRVVIKRDAAKTQPTEGQPQQTAETPFKECTPGKDFRPEKLQFNKFTPIDVDGKRYYADEDGTVYKRQRTGLRESKLVEDAESRHIELVPKAEVKSAIPDIKVVPDAIEMTAEHPQKSLPVSWQKEFAFLSEFKRALSSSDVPAARRVEGIKRAMREYSDTTPDEQARYIAELTRQLKTVGVKVELSRGATSQEPAKLVLSVEGSYESLVVATDGSSVELEKANPRRQTKKVEVDQVKVADALSRMDRAVNRSLKTNETRESVMKQDPELAKDASAKEVKRSFVEGLPISWREAREHVIAIDNALRQPQGKQAAALDAALSKFQGASKEVTDRVSHEVNTRKATATDTTAGRDAPHLLKARSLPLTEFDRKVLKLFESGTEAGQKEAIDLMMADAKARAKRMGLPEKLITPEFMQIKYTPESTGGTCFTCVYKTSIYVGPDCSPSSIIEHELSHAAKSLKRAALRMADQKAFDRAVLEQVMQHVGEGEPILSPQEKAAQKKAWREYFESVIENPSRKSGSPIAQLGTAGRRFMELSQHGNRAYDLFFGIRDEAIIDDTVLKTREGVADYLNKEVERLKAQKQNDGLASNPEMVKATKGLAESYQGKLDETTYVTLSVEERSARRAQLTGNLRDRLKDQANGAVGDLTPEQKERARADVTENQATLKELRMETEMQFALDAFARSQNQSLGVAARNAQMAKAKYHADRAVSNMHPTAEVDSQHNQDLLKMYTELEKRQLVTEVWDMPPVLRDLRLKQGQISTAPPSAVPDGGERPPLKAPSPDKPGEAKGDLPTMRELYDNRRRGELALTMPLEQLQRLPAEARALIIRSMTPEQARKLPEGHLEQLTKDFGFEHYREVLNADHGLQIVPKEMHAQMLREATPEQIKSLNFERRHTLLKDVLSAETIASMNTSARMELLRLSSYDQLKLVGEKKLLALTEGFTPAQSRELLSRMKPQAVNAIPHERRVEIIRQIGREGIDQLTNSKWKELLGEDPSPSKAKQIFDAIGAENVRALKGERSRALIERMNESDVPVDMRFSTNPSLDRPPTAKVAPAPPKAKGVQTDRVVVDYTGASAETLVSNSLALSTLFAEFQKHAGKGDLITQMERFRICSKDALKQDFGKTEQSKTACLDSLVNDFVGQLSDPRFSAKEMPLLRSASVKASKMEGAGKVVYKVNNAIIEPLFATSSGEVFYRTPDGRVRSTVASDVKVELHISEASLAAIDTSTPEGRLRANEVVSTLFHQLHQVSQLTGREDRARAFNVDLRSTEGTTQQRFLEAEKAVVDLSANYLQYRMNNHSLNGSEVVHATPFSLDVVEEVAKLTGERIVTSMGPDGRIKIFVLRGGQSITEIDAARSEELVKRSFENWLKICDKNIEEARKAKNEELVKRLQERRDRIVADQHRYNTEPEFRKTVNHQLGKANGGSGNMERLTGKVGTVVTVLFLTTVAIDQLSKMNSEPELDFKVEIKGK
ncbi:MAG: hypothetical protein K2X93_04040 [Candidatus Obscuribacterales bacterium]|nr:hypothetical protein [Candidatus Obscuribacterales bacterium]